MNTKKLAVCLLSATMLLQSSSIVMAKEENTLKVLTLEKAIKDAQNSSTQLKISEQGVELQKEQKDIDRLMGNYFAYDQSNVTYQGKLKDYEADKEKIALDVTKLFDSILVAETDLENIIKSIELEEKQMAKAKVQYESGLVSTYNVEQMNLQLAQLKNQKTTLEENVDLMYYQLCSMIGSTTQKFILEKPELVFEPYREIRNPKDFAKNLAKEHLATWKAKEQSRVLDSTPLFTQDYMMYVSGKTQREIAKNTAELTQDNYEQLIYSKYVQMRNLEKQYVQQKQALELASKQQLINEAYLNNGMMSQLDYETQKLTYEKSQADLEKTLNEHYYLKVQLDQPNLI